MRQDMQSVHNRSLRSTLQKSHKAFEESVGVLRRNLFELKKQIVEECKYILEDFKKRGIVALNGITRFLHLKPVLEAIQISAENSVQASNRTICRIDMFSKEYHEAGQHLKNMSRALRGKKIISEAKENGKIVGAFKRAICAKRSCVSAIRQSAKQALNQLLMLEQAAQKRSSVIQSVRRQTTKSGAPKDCSVKVQTER